LINTFLSLSKPAKKRLFYLGFREQVILTWVPICSITMALWLTIFRPTKIWPEDFRQFRSLMWD